MDSGKYLCGYPRISPYIDPDVDAVLFRKFGILRARNLLYKEVEIIELENQLYELDQADAGIEEAVDSRRLQYSSWIDKPIKKSNEINEARCKLMQIIETKLEEHDNILGSSIERIQQSSRKEPIKCHYLQDDHKGLVHRENERSKSMAPGLELLIQGVSTPTCGDTGSTIHVIRDDCRQQLGLGFKKKKHRITMGNGKSFRSEGTVEVVVAFAEDPTKTYTLTAQVVKKFLFKFLVGEEFLNTTETMTRHIHRFVKCLLPTSSLWSWNRLSETSSRFAVTIDTNIPVLGLADTGSGRNIMSMDFAERYGFEVHSQPDNLGWVTFPNGVDEATVGQVKTSIMFADGKTIPITFEVLPGSMIDVVLGIDLIIDNNIYQQYPDSFHDFETEYDAQSLLCHMGYEPWYTRMFKYMTKKSKNRIQTFESPETTELKRQHAWDVKYQRGITASIEEWNIENDKRRAYEQSRHPGLTLDNNHPLIPHRPQGFARDASGVSWGPMARGVNCNEAGVGDFQFLVENPWTTAAA